MDLHDIADLEKDVAQESAARIARNDALIERVKAKREADDAYLRKPMDQWTEAEWRRFHIYENDARTWTRSW